MDRCALFVDAGYVLADGAMAVHGTRNRESVSWDYAGLLQFLGNIARDRTGLPLLRCYWYEATVEGRRTSEHDALADLPGLKLRLGRMRPGKREGVESEIHRDLTALARNQAISDALVVSAEEDLAQVVADVQDLGVRVVVVHLTVDGNWTISRSLRQECDDIVEIGEAHLRPYAELVAGAEPVQDEAQFPAAAYAGRQLTNGHGPVGALGPQQALPAGSSPAPPAIYTAPVVAEYQRSAQPALNGQSPPPGMPGSAADGDGGRQHAGPQQAGLPQPGPHQTGQHQVGAPHAGLPQPAQQQPGPQAGQGPQHTGPQQARPPQGEQHPAPAQMQPGRAGHEQQAPGQQAHPQPQPPGQPQHQQGGQAPQPPGQPQPHPVGRAMAPAGMPDPGRQQQQYPGQQPGYPAAIGAGPSAPPQQQGAGPGVPQGHPQPPPGYPGMPGQPGPGPVPPGMEGQQGGRGPARGPGGQPHPGQQAVHHSHPLPAQQPYPGQPHPGQPQEQAPQGPPRQMYPAPPAGFGNHQDMPGGRGPQGNPGPPGHQPANASGPVLTGHPGQGHPGQGHPGQGYPMPGQGQGGLPQRGGSPYPYPPGPPGYPPPPPPQRYQGQPNHSGPQQYAGAQAGRPDPRQQPGPGYVPQQGPYSGPHPAGHAPVPQPVAMSLADAVQSAHAEGFDFGQSVAREAPALWLEAVLARKPRMPSDLEARLLQDSALPIDSLLHDEVRHALRRGFWDALERARH